MFTDLSGKNSKKENFSRIHPGLGINHFHSRGISGLLQALVCSRDQIVPPFTHTGIRQMKRTRHLLSMQSFIRKKGMNYTLWHQDANHIRHHTITSPTRVHRQALTRTGTWKRTNTIPWTTLILILPIIHRKNHRSPHGTTLIPSRQSRDWISIMVPMRIARDRQR